MNELPLICNLGALTPEQRIERAELAALLGTAVDDVEEFETGYRLHIPIASLPHAEQLLALEGRCCSFLKLALHRDATGATLEIGGPEGAKAFIAAELGELVARNR
jgi:hypothetical protein